MKTKEKLIQALIDAQAPPEMIEKARQGYYDTLESTVEWPINQLIADATAAGLMQIVDRAVGGEFDETDEEADEFLRKKGLFDDLTDKGISPFEE